MSCWPEVEVGAKYMLSFETDPATGNEYEFTRLRPVENVSDEPPTDVLPKVAAPAVTTAVWAEEAGAEDPPPLDAVTTARNVEDTSAACTTYLEALAPEIAEQLAPPESQRSQAYAYPVGELDHDPELDVNVCPDCATPDTTGKAVFTGTAGGEPPGW